jgi:hypothetical protein
MGKKWLYFEAGIIFPDPKMPSHVLNGFVLVSSFIMSPTMLSINVLENILVTLNQMLSEFVFLGKFGW